MQQEAFDALARRLYSADEGIHIADLSDEEMADLTPEQAAELVAMHGWNTLIRLPKREREFFDWLRREDAAIWEDLWGNDEEPYVVSLSCLLDLLPKRRGFAVNDLEQSQNFYFTAENISAEEGKPIVDAALDIIAANGRLSMDQAFLVEVWRAPIDQWRFAYMYNVPLAEVKQMVIWLLSEGMLTLAFTEGTEESTTLTDDDES